MDLQCRFRIQTIYLISAYQHHQEDWGKNLIQKNQTKTKTKKR